MASLTPDQVRHIAKLARLRLTEEEVERYTTQLTSILSYVEMLQKVDTKNVAPATQVIGLSHVLRADEVRPALASPDDLLATSPLPLVDHQIETPSAHG